MKRGVHLVDLTGQRFGRLTVIRYNVSTASKCDCVCDCGALKTIQSSDLRRGWTTSCGCYRREATAKNRTKHGCIGSKSTPLQKKLYICYNNMMSRCYDDTNKCWNLYGERGIKVCDEWRQSFQNFADDMGIPPSVSHTIERRDFNGNYQLSNCYWATQSEQALNRRNNHLVTINGQTKPIKVWSDETGINYHTLHGRITRGIMPVEKWLSR